MKALGLDTVDATIKTLNVGDFQLPVLIMQRFSALAEKGIQVRDQKNPKSSCGHTMLFGSEENGRNPAYLKTVMKPLVDDCVDLMSRGLSFGGDEVNLAIKIPCRRLCMTAASRA